MQGDLKKIILMPMKWFHIIAIFIFLGFSIYLFYPKIENFFVFFPDRSFDFTPEQFQLSYGEVHFTGKDGTPLHGWYFPGDPESPVVLFCHGNAGNISHRLDNVKRLVNCRLGVFIFDYRGYGKSRGRPSEKGIYSDGLAAYDYLLGQKRVPPDQLTLFGRSLGAAVAIEIASRKEVRSLIIESAFTSTQDMAKTMLLFAPFYPLLPAHYNNLEKIASIGVPKLIIHGERDEIVPFSMGRQLYEAAPDPKFFYPIKNAGHNDTYEVGGIKYFQRFKEFAKKGRL